MTLDEEAKVAGSSLFCSRTGSSNISGISKEQLDQLLETFESNPNLSAEQTSELAEKLKLTTGQVQLWFRMERLEMEALTLEAQCLLQGIVPPELQRRIQQDDELGLLQDKLKLLVQENEQGTGSSNISGLSKEQLDQLLETFESNPNPSVEQKSELAEKLKLTVGQVQLWFRKERLDLQKKVEALALEVGCMLQGIVTPELQRRVEQNGEIRLLLDKLKVLDQENEQGKIKLLQDKCKVLELHNELLIADRKIEVMQEKVKVRKLENELLITKGMIKLLQDRENEQLTESNAGHTSLLRCSERENMVGAVQLGPPPTPGPDCDTGTPSYPDERKRASESSFEQGNQKNARRE